MSIVYVTMSFTKTRNFTDFIITIFFQTYADEGHELSNVLEHVYKSMEHYLKDCLSLEDDMKPEPVRGNRND